MHGRQILGSLNVILEVWSVVCLSLRPYGESKRHSSRCALAVLDPWEQRKLLDGFLMMVLIKRWLAIRL
jgi:hypothetical protein